MNAITSGSIYKNIYKIKSHISLNPISKDAIKSNSKSQVLTNE